MKYFDQTNNIKKLYNIKNKRNFIFELCSTTTDRYLIIEDNVFDLFLDKSLGNLWENIDTFKEIFKNVNIENKEYKIIQEEIKNIPILENKTNLTGLKNILLEFNFLEDTWLGQEMKKTGKGIYDFTKDSYNGLKKFGVAISQGQWGEIIKMLSQGVKFILRKLKDALFSTAGGVVDAILVATGVGKTVQWIPWALVTSLDIYQLMYNDFPDDEKNNPLWLKYLMLGVDLIGLVSTGAMAIAAKNTLSPLKPLLNNPNKLRQFINNSPKIKTIIEQIIKSVSAAITKIKSAYNIFKTKFPKGGEFIGKIINGLNNFFNKFINSFKKLLNNDVTRSVTKSIGTDYGVQKITNVGNDLISKLSPQQIKNLANLVNILG